MKPIIFVRIAGMKFYRGITENDRPANGGAYVTETGLAHECYNFESVDFENGDSLCLGYAQIIAASSNSDPQIHIENIVGCELLKKEEAADDVTVVWCAKSEGSKSLRVVGFYKHATVFRNIQHFEFSNDYTQYYEFIAESKDCYLIPYNQRFANAQWFVPISHKHGYNFGFGHSSFWYAGSNTNDENEIAYVERMLKSVDEYKGKNNLEDGGVI